MWKRRLLNPRRLSWIAKAESASLLTARATALRHSSTSVSASWNTVSPFRPQSHSNLERARNTQAVESRRYASSATSAAELKKTPLYDFHIQHGAKMVPFGGYSMPVDYKSLSVVESSRWTRENASIFDVSHMTQHKFSGPGATKFLETVSPGGIGALKPFSSTYSAFLNNNGGIVDDTIITNITAGAPAGPTTYHVVTNAANHTNNEAYFADQVAKFKAKNPDGVVDWEIIPNTGLIALQGPKAPEVLASLGPRDKSGPYDLNKLTFGNAVWLTLHEKVEGNEIFPHPVLVSRTGYTGEDGFEISVPHPDGHNATLALTEKLLENSSCEMAGLAARDALRLEAGLCLHGSDIDAETTPLDASLVWIIPKDRRSPDAGFNGASKLYGDSAVPSARKRIGILLDGKVVARHGSTIKDASGSEVGVVTSGGPSPCMDGKPIAMALVSKKGPKVGEEVKIIVRGKERPGKVVKMPFVETKYFKG